MALKTVQLGSLQPGEWFSRVDSHNTLWFVLMDLEVPQGLLRCVCPKNEGFVRLFKKTEQVYPAHCPY